MGRPSYLSYKIGDEFGKATLQRELGYEQRGKRKVLIWELLCHCGQVFTAAKYDVTGHRTNSCGCLRRSNLLNKRFGNAIVKAYAGYGLKGPKSKRKVPLWLMLCDCGNEYKAITEYLVKGFTTSCGCQDQKQLFYIDQPNKTLTLEKIYKNMLYGATKRNLTVDSTITLAYLEQLLIEQNYRCALSGLELNWEIASVDRIDSNLGYILGNVQWVYRTLNFMKLSLSQDRFIELCSMVSNYQQSLI